GLVRSAEPSQHVHHGSAIRGGWLVANSLATAAAIAVGAPLPGPPPSTNDTTVNRALPLASNNRPANQPLSGRPVTCAVPVLPPRRQPVPWSAGSADRPVPS